MILLEYKIIMPELSIVQKQIKILATLIQNLEF